MNHMSNQQEPEAALCWAETGDLKLHLHLVGLHRGPQAMPPSPAPGWGTSVGALAPGPRWGSSGHASMH